MKELMVTLLVLSFTGMVMAQQDNGNGFRANSGAADGSRFGSSDRAGSTPIVPIVNEDGSESARRPPASRIQNFQGSDRNTRARNSFATSGTDERASTTSETAGLLNPNRRVRDSFQTGSTGQSTSNSNRVVEPGNKVLYLGLPEDAMGVLLRDGRVKAPVKNPYVDRIKISDQNTPKAGPTRTIRPQLVGDSLVFTFTQDDVDFTHEGSLEFEVPAYMKHQYTSATIEIPEILARNTQPNQTPRRDSGFQADDSRWRIPGETNVRQPIRQNDGFTNNQRNETELERLRRLEYEKFLREKEAREKAELANKNRELQDQIDRLRYEQRQAAARVQPQQPVVYPNERYADGRFDPLRQPVTTRPVVPPASVDSVSYSYAMLQKMQQMEARVAQLGDENLKLKRDMQYVKAESDESFRNRFDFKNDTRNNLVQDRSRTAGFNDRVAGKAPVQNRPAMSVGEIANSNRNGSKAGAGGIMTAQTKTDANKHWELLLFLMLLGSVALNLYLWALSRGFYMRYQELADELRETFTVTA